jgi:predicted CopG family antitoxin
MADDVTTVKVKEETWKRLNARKTPGKSFDDIISELLDEVEEADEGNPKTARAD